MVGFKIVGLIMVMKKSERDGVLKPSSAKSPVLGDRGAEPWEGKTLRRSPRSHPALGCEDPRMGSHGLCVPKSPRGG